MRHRVVIRPFAAVGPSRLPVNWAFVAGIGCWGSGTPRIPSSIPVAFPLVRGLLEPMGGIRRPHDLA